MAFKNPDQAGRFEIMRGVNAAGVDGLPSELRDCARHVRVPHLYYPAAGNLHRPSRWCWRRCAIAV